MKKFLLLVLATLSIASCANKSTIRSSNNNASTGSNVPITTNQNEDKYTIRFLNDGGSVLSSKQYEFGAMPEAPDTPSKENPLEEYTYTFSGWSPSIALVTSDADYVATYEADAKIGEVKWIDGDGETLLTENYAYGSMPNYHGDIPTKTSTDTETYVFKGWSPEISLVASESITYVAQFNPVPISTEYSIQINCTDCLVNKKKSINEKYAPLTDLTYQFNNTSKETYHYPYKLDVTVDGVTTNDYAYDNITGKLNIKLKGNTVINAVADNSCVLMKYEYSEDYPTVEITCDGDFESVDWGDGVKDTNKTHTYSPDSNIDQYDIRIFGKLDSIGTTSKAVTSVNIFHSVFSIGIRAFQECLNLSSITIPSSVTSIGESAFLNCSSLLVIYCKTESQPDGWDSDWNYNRYPVVWGYIGNGEYNNFRYGVSSIGGNKSIVITGLVNKSITTAIIPSMINVDGEDIPVTSIGQRAFNSYDSLTSVTVPNSITSIGYSAFVNCSSLVLYCEVESRPGGWHPDWNYNNRPVVWGYVSSGEYNNLKYAISSIGGNKSIVITGLVDKSVTAVTIPSTINVDGEDISVTSIGYSVFENCSSLNSVTIPNSITSIGEHAFYKCSKLSSIIISSSVASIGGFAFYNCSSLMIYCEAESKPSGWHPDWNYNNRPVVWGYISSGEYNNLKYAISSIGGNKSIVITGLVNKSITTAIIPSMINVDGEDIPVTSIGQRAFDSYDSLTSVTIPNSVTSVGDRAFYFCSSLVIYCEAESKPSGWHPDWNYNNRPVIWGYISSGEYNNLKYAISSIGGNKSIVITGLVDKTVTAVTIPSTINVGGEDVPVTSIGYSVFENCSSLNSITIPNSITSIGEHAFYECSKLSSIIIPDSIISIGNGAFNSCSSLASIIIPDSVTSMGSGVFMYCSSLQTIYCEAESQPSGWNSNWKYECSANVIWGYNP